MVRASTGRRRGVGSRVGGRLKIAVGALLVLLVLMILNAFALNNETGSAEVTVPGAQLVPTSAGKLQVLDTGPAAGTDGSAAASLPIVLIHGSAGSIRWWDEVIPLLASQHRVIAIDMLGYGGSDKPDSDYAIETQARLVAEVLARLDTPQAVLVGHSLGGKVVTSVAEQSPDLVAGLVVMDTAPDNSYGSLSGGAKATRTPMLGQALWRIAPDFMIRRNIEQGFAPGFNVSDRFVDDVRAMTYKAYKQSAIESENYTDEAALPDRLAETGKPLLVIFGEEDQIYSARESLSAYAAIPGVETVLIPGIGHSPQVEAPEKTADAIGEFSLSIARQQAAEARQETARKARARAKAKAKARAKARAQSRAKARTGNRRNRNQNP